jgi:WD40 repeat protein
MDRPGQIRIWSIDRPSGPLRVLDGTGTGFGVGYSPGGRWLAAYGDVDSGLVRLWDLKAPDWAEPLSIRTGSNWLSCFQFAPDDRWLATGGPAALWPRGRHAWVLKRHRER